MGRPTSGGPSVAFALALLAVAISAAVAVSAAPGVARSPAALPRTAGANVPIVVGIDPRPDAGTVPLTVDLVGVASGGSGRFVEYGWTLGDGGHGLGEQFNYTFERAGIFLVALEVTDSSGATGSASIEIEVNATAAIAAAGVLDPALPLGGGAVAGTAMGLVAWRWGTGRARLRVSPPVAPPEPAAAGSPPTEPREGERESTAAPSPTPTAESIGLSQRLLGHLLRQPALGPNEIVPPGRTQADIASALGASQSSVSEILTRLVAAGVVGARTRHVQGRPRRVRVYSLTSYGDRLARQIVPGGAPGPLPYSSLGRLPEPLPSMAPSEAAEGRPSGAEAGRPPATQSGSEGP